MKKTYTTPAVEQFEIEEIPDFNNLPDVNLFGN